MARKLGKGHGLGSLRQYVSGHFGQMEPDQRDEKKACGPLVISLRRRKRGEEKQQLFRNVYQLFTGSAKKPYVAWGRRKGEKDAVMRGSGGNHAKDGRGVRKDCGSSTSFIGVVTKCSNCCPGRIGGAENQGEPLPTVSKRLADRTEVYDEWRKTGMGELHGVIRDLERFIGAQFLSETGRAILQQ